MSFLVNETRLQADIETLATFVNPELPGYTRRPFTPEYTRSRRWLQEQMEAAGLNTKYDAAANLIGVRDGKNSKLQPIMIGSHTDSVVGGGRFDGIIGVLGAIEIARQLEEQGIELEHPLHIVDFTAEEASEFGISTIGSRGMVGALHESYLERKNDDGLTLADGLTRQGGNPDQLNEMALTKGDIALYLELHIEQGPVLAEKGYELGAVTGIVGIERYRITVTGQPNHAGTTPMNMRQDALTAASESILAIESIANESYEVPVVGTVGRIFSEPNAANIVPGEVRLEIGLRSIRKSALQSMVQKMNDFVQGVLKKRDVDVTIEKISESEPVAVSPEILNNIYDACMKVGKTKKLPSGAGHDANQLASIAPVGMIFVPSKDGKSHCPEEWTDYELVAKGVAALGNALLSFDRQLLK